MKIGLLMLCCLTTCVGYGTSHIEFLNDGKSMMKQNSINAIDLYGDTEQSERIFLHIDNQPYLGKCISIEFDADRKYDITTDSSTIDIVSFGEKEGKYYFSFEPMSDYCEGNIFFCSDDRTTVFSSTLYVYRTQFGTFVNQISQRLNSDKYESYRLKKKLITQEEFDLYNAATNSDFVTEIIKPKKQASILNPMVRPNKLYGGFSWTDSNDNIHPLCFNRVEFLERTDNGIVKLNEALTDENGKYSFTVPEATTGSRECFIRVFSQGKYSGVVKDLEEEDYYYYDSSSINVTSGMKNKGLVFEKSYTFSKDTLSNNFLSRAMEISQALNYGEKYSYEMTGDHPNYVLAEYPSVHKDHNDADYIGPRSDSKTKGIRYGFYTYNYWDLILHEYGHHLQYWLDITDSPGGRHYSNKEDKDPKLAWGESWPTIFANLVTKYYSNVLTGIPYIDDDNYDAPDSNQRWGYSLENLENGIKYGEKCERDIMYVLFDLFDGFNSSEPFDKVSLNHQGLWDLVYNSAAYTFSEFYEYVINQDIIDINVDDFKNICLEYGMHVH